MSVAAGGLKSHGCDGAFSPPPLPHAALQLHSFYWKANGSLDMVWRNQNSIVKLNFITFS